MFSIVMSLTLGIVLFVLLLLQWNSCVKVISKQNNKHIKTVEFEDDMWFNENE